MGSWGESVGVDLLVSVCWLYQSPNYAANTMVDVPGPDNDCTLDGIWYGIVGKILSYLMPQCTEFPR